MQEREISPAGVGGAGEAAVQPSTQGGEPLLTNPVGFRFVMSEIAERNPIVRQALLRRAEGWTG